MGFCFDIVFMVVSCFVGSCITYANLWCLHIVSCVLIWLVFSCELFGFGWLFCVGLFC